MPLFNPTQKNKPKQTAHANWMGGPSYEVTDPIQRLRMAAASCFFGEPMYYQRDSADARPLRHDPRWRLDASQLAYLRETLNATDPQTWRELSPTELMEQAIDEALQADVEATLQVAVSLRNEDLIRTTPQVILVRAANGAGKGTGLIRQYAPQIIKRADEPAVQLAYQLYRYGKPVPNSLKRAWRDALERFDEYQLAKYRLESHQVSTIDVVNLVYGLKPMIGAAYQSDTPTAIDKLVRGELKSNEQTWEAIVSAKGSNREAWSDALNVMGHMALLRNLRNLLKHEIPVEQFSQKLVDGANYGKQLPFRYWSAYQAVQQDAPPSLLDAIETAMTTSLDNLPQFAGKVMSLCDNSGSARGTTTSAYGKVRINEIANLTGVLTGMQADEGYLGVFGDRLEAMPIRKRSSIFDQLKQANKIGDGIGGGTENGIWLFWDQAIQKQEHWDMVFVYSDMQAGHGGLYGTNPRAYKSYRWQKSRYIDVPKLIADYRRNVNPQVQVFLVQVAGYQDTIVPEFYNKTYILGGWSGNILKFAARMMGQ